MVSKEYEQTLSELLAEIKKSCVKAFDLKDLYRQGITESAPLYLSEIKETAAHVETAYLPFKDQLEYAYIPEMLDNIDCTTDEIEKAYSDENMERAAFKTEFQLLPFLRLLWEAFYFRGFIYPDASKLSQYYRDEYAEHYRNIYVGKHDPKYKLTIAICGYNHLDTTKQCVEQLVRRTDFKKLNAELLLVDHGSTDGTLKYFEGLGKYKVIHCKNNIHMNVFELISQISLGEYFCFVSNDILVTKNWAEILLKCMDSDDKIICAMPTTPNISNLQTYEIPDTLPAEPKEFIMWANEHNRSNPSLWNDRARLMPCICMYNTANVSKVGFGDPYYYTMEFWDDDFSLRSRRAGMRQILCKDVACYHFGSVTTTKAKTEENTLEFGRRLFIKKNGVDAWGNGFCYDLQAVSLLKDNIITPGNPSFLGIDCGFGDTPLQFRNEMRKSQKDSKLFMLTKQSEYMPDLSNIGDEAQYSPDLIKGVRESFSDEKFAAAYIGLDISEYPDFPGLLEQISLRMYSGGLLVFCCQNPFYILNYDAAFKLSLPQSGFVYSAADPNRVIETAKRFYSDVVPAAVNQPVSGTEDFAARHFPGQSITPQLINLLNTLKYYIICRK